MAIREIATNLSLQSWQTWETATREIATNLSLQSW